MAPRSEEAAAWFATVYRAIQEIPEGKVTTYSRVARLVGYPERPRQVGVALKQLPDNASLPFHSGNVPWQRVINAQGQISHRGIGGASRQADALRAEGVEVTEWGGEFMINLDDFGWFPDMLPSESAELEDDEGRSEAGQAGE